MGIKNRVTAHGLFSELNLNILSLTVSNRNAHRCVLTHFIYLNILNWRHFCLNTSARSGFMLDQVCWPNSHIIYATETTWHISLVIEVFVIFLNIWESSNMQTLHKLQHEMKWKTGHLRSWNWEEGKHVLLNRNTQCFIGTLLLLLTHSSVVNPFIWFLSQPPARTPITSRLERRRIYSEDKMFGYRLFSEPVWPPSPV